MENIPYEKLILQGDNPLHWAAQNNDVDLIEELIEKHHFSPNTCNFRATNSLYFAAIHNNMDACKKLLEYGADPRDKSGFSSWYPDEAAEDSEIKEFLFKLRTRLENAIEHNSALNSIYRIRRWGEDCISYFTQKSTPGEKFWPEDYIILDGFTEENIAEMAQKLQEEWKIFNKLLDDWEKGCFKNNQVCVFCCSTEGKKLLCGKCREVYYCDAECQKKAHPCHKNLCKIKI